MKPETAISIAILGVVGTLVFLAVRKGQAVVDAVNPLNNDNAIAQGFDELITLGQADESFSLGAFFSRLFNPDFENFDPNASPGASGRPIRAIPPDQVDFIPVSDIPSKRGPGILSPPGG